MDKKMNPSRELDALVAEKVMGWENNYDNPGGTREPHMWGIMDFTPEGPVRAPNFPCYSTDIAAAWAVVEKVFKDEWRMDLTGSECFGEKLGGFDVRFSCKCEARGRFDAEGDTAPHAICIAALKAVGVEV